MIAQLYKQFYFPVGTHLISGHLFDKSSVNPFEQVVLQINSALFCAAVECMFSAMCDCQALHPDPEDSDSDNEEFEGEEYEEEETGKASVLK